MLRGGVAARVGGTRGGGLAAVTVLTVLTVLAIASSGITWATAAPAENTQKDYPEVDVSKLVVHEFPAGTPQTTATGVTDPSEADRTLAPGYVEKEFLVQGDASTYGGPVTGPVEVTQTNVPYRHARTRPLPEGRVEVQRPRRGRAVQHQQ